MSSAYFVKSGGVGERRSQRTHQKCSHALFIISQQKKKNKTPPLARGAYGNRMPQDFKHKRKKTLNLMPS